MKISDLSISFGNKYIFKNINLEIKKGEFVFFIGNSGSGKTSLIRTIIGDLKPSSGDVIFDNGLGLYLNYSDKIISEHRKKTGVIFQDYKLVNTKTVEENITFAMEVCGFSKKEILKTVPENLARVGLLYKKDSYPTELSGGEKQRVAIARALSIGPDIIIGDEPTGNLDPETSMQIMEIFRDLNEEGKTIIIATHDKNIVNHFGQRVVSFGDKGILFDKENSDYEGN